VASGAGRRGLKVSGSFSLVYPDIIYEQVLGKNGIIHSFLAAPVSADGEIEYDEKILIVWPGVETITWICVGKVGAAVHVPGDPVGCPFNGIDMKAVLGIRDEGAAALLGSLGTIIHLVMGSSVNDIGIKAYFFHDVQFPVVRPDQGLGRGKQPYSRPGTNAPGQFGADFKFSIRPLCLGFGEQAG